MRILINLNSVKENDLNWRGGGRGGGGGSGLECIFTNIFFFPSSCLHPNDGIKNNFVLTERQKHFGLTGNLEHCCRKRWKP